MSINIRPARPEDSEKLAQMLAGICALHHDGRPDLFRAGARKFDASDVCRILDDADRPILVAAETGESDREDAPGEAVGYAFCQLRRITGQAVLLDRIYLYIDDFCIDPAYRRRHIGHRLMDAVTDLACARGAERIELNVWNFNEGALRFYESCGFATQRREMELPLSGNNV